MTLDTRRTARHRAFVVAAALAGVAALSVFAQAPIPAPAAGAPQGRAGGRGGGAQEPAGADFSPKPPVQARTPDDEAKTFMLPVGYRLELVASDPDLNNPAVIDWDGR
jgi:hypothetical protein